MKLTIEEIVKVMFYFILTSLRLVLYMTMVKGI